MIDDPRGSLWRKWDLQVHPPRCKLYDGYKATNDTDPMDTFCNLLEASNVQVFGITDYFSVEAFRAFMERFNKRYPKSEKTFFFNLELRLNETVNKETEEVNVHLLFNPDSLSSIDKFLNRLKVEKTGRDLVAVTCAELTTYDDFASATVSRKSIADAFEDTFGRKAIRQDHFLIITAANNDRKANILMEQRSLEERIANIKTEKGSAADRAAEFFELANSLYLGYKSGIFAEKSDLVKMATSNRSVNGKNVVVEPSFPFELVAKRSTVLNGAR